MNTAIEAPTQGGARNAGVPAVEAWVSQLDWAEAERSLDRDGHAVLPGLLSAAQCAALA